MIKKQFDRSKIVVLCSFVERSTAKPTPEVDVEFAQMLFAVCNEMIFPLLGSYTTTFVQPPFEVILEGLAPSDKIISSLGRGLLSRSTS